LKFVADETLVTGKFKWKESLKQVELLYFYKFVPLRRNI
jgi:hypothetical protein